MSGALVDFLAALQFLTVTPPILRRAFSSAQLGRATAYYPLVGLLIGLLLAVAGWLLGRVFPPFVVAALLLVLWVLASGALHLDGFLDACDGLFGGSTPERRLEIMRDERIGAFAFAGGALLLLVKFSALAMLVQNLPALVLAPVLGRWAMSLAVVAFPYARAEGLGREIKAHAGRPQALLATLLALAAAWLCAGARGLAALAVALLVLLLATRFTLARLPGLTGDIYGLLNELVEVAVLLVCVAAP